MSAFTKTHDLRKKNKAELEQQLADLKQELSALRVQKIASGNANKVAQIGHVRKAIARVLTILSQVQRAELKGQCNKKKYIPTDLRVKKTRAIRRRLTTHESKLVTERQHKKNIHFSLRKYALKAE